MTEQAEATAPPTPRTGRATAASLVVRLAALFVLAGAIAKMKWGSPLDLPPVIRDLGLGMALTFKLVLMAELGVAAITLVSPRAGFPLLSLLEIAFVTVLVVLMIKGAESCGCFGSAMTISPAAMLAIHAVLLLAMMATRPWSALRGTPLRPLLLVPVLGVALAVPWFVEGSGPKPILLEPHKWAGMKIEETPLKQHLKLEELPDTGTWVFYRKTCEVCARHLEELSKKKDGAFYTLVLVPERDDKDKKDLCLWKPQAVEVSLADGPIWNIHTPTVMELDNGVVKGAQVIAH